MRMSCLFDIRFYFLRFFSLPYVRGVCGEEAPYQHFSVCALTVSIFPIKYANATHFVSRMFSRPVRFSIHTHTHTHSNLSCNFHSNKLFKYCMQFRIGGVGKGASDGGVGSIFAFALNAYCIYIWLIRLLLPLTLK